MRTRPCKGRRVMSCESLARVPGLSFTHQAADREGPRVKPCSIVTFNKISVHFPTNRDIFLGTCKPLGTQHPCPMNGTWRENFRWIHFIPMLRFGYTVDVAALNARYFHLPPSSHQHCHRVVYGFLSPRMRTACFSREFPSTDYTKSASGRRSDQRGLRAVL